MSRSKDLDPEGKRLPIRFDGTSNGEFLPFDTPPAQKAANALAHETATENARKLGIGRRAFLASSMGAAATLAACNRVNPGSGGSYAVSEEASFETAAAEEAVGGDEFIFDVQTHCVDPSASWAQGRDGQIWEEALSRAFGQSTQCDDGSYDCYSAQTLAREVFLDSDTDVAVVSALWGTAESNPTPIEYAAEARGIMEAIGGERSRCLIHGGVLANDPGELEAMDEKVEVHGIDAWKLYPQWGPDQVGFFLDESEHADRMFANARRLGKTVIAVHKGISLYGLDPLYSSPRDMGNAATRNPDLTFLVYHSGFQPGVEEFAYNPDGEGVDRLIRAHREAGLRPNEGNLYAELGSLWRYFMGRPEEAAHVMGKLLATFGEDRIIWGTDSIWYGSPQDQIQSFRAFEISAEYQERFGYPALTRDAKRKIFGLNAAQVYDLDPAVVTAGSTLGERRTAHRAEANPSFATYGPKTRREFMANWAAHGGRPG